MALGRKAEADRVIEQALALPFPNQGREMPVDRQMTNAITVIGTILRPNKPVLQDHI